MRTNRLSAALCCLALTFVGCDGMGGRKPASTGLPYEVVLEGDSDSIVTRMMTADMPHLPQPEPMFSLIQVRKGKVRGSYQLVRNRIVVDINAHNKGYAVKMRKDVSAVPQTVVYIQAQSSLRHIGATASCHRRATESRQAEGDEAALRHQHEDSCLDECR